MINCCKTDMMGLLIVRITSELSYILQCIQTYLDKFKEKKPMVVTALRDAIDAAWMSVSIYIICACI